MAPENLIDNMEKLNVADDYQTYKLGDFKLKSGEKIPNAFIAYKTLGDPSLPAVIYPSWYSGCMKSPTSSISPLFIPKALTHSSDL